MNNSNGRKNNPKYNKGKHIIADNTENNRNNSDIIDNTKDNKNNNGITDDMNSNKNRNTKNSDMNFNVNHNMSSDTISNINYNMQFNINSCMNSDSDSIIYDVIIIGAGASGLFAAASLDLNNFTSDATGSPSQHTAPADLYDTTHHTKIGTSSSEQIHAKSSPSSANKFSAEPHSADCAFSRTFRGLILEKTPHPGTKLLMSGSGQCNITHAGSIKDFVKCYGNNGKKIRSCLYKYSNISLMDFLCENGIEVFTRDDGKVFPASMDAHDVLYMLLRRAKKNGFEIRCNTAVTNISKHTDSCSTHTIAPQIPEVVSVSDDITAPVNAITPITAKANAKCTTKLMSQTSAVRAEKGIPSFTKPSTAESITHVSTSADTILIDNIPNDNHIANINDCISTDSGNINTIADTILADTITDNINESAGGNCRIDKNKTGSGSNKPLWCIHSSDTVYTARSVIIATGGCSYPSTGSDGSMFRILKDDLGISITKLKPALSSMQVQDYPYSELSGISFSNVHTSIWRDDKKTAETCEALLFTHKDLSGPAIINISKFAETGDRLRINYLYPMSYEQVLEKLKSVMHGAKGSPVNIISTTFDIPKRFCQIIVKRSGTSLKAIASSLTGDEFVIASVSGFNRAMATSGGIDLSQINTTTFEFREHPGLYAIGEALDIDGITGGYNLQFAYSSANAAATAIAKAAVNGNTE